jgi:arylsulfatase A-like enzyme
MPDLRPNILFIMSDDHAAHAMTCYGSRINETPNMDRIAAEGVRFDNCFCTNSICAPSRATILTGTYSHVNGVPTLFEGLDARTQPTFPPLLQQAGYQTAMIGKWHLGHNPENHPAGFDYWNVLPGQGLYHNPNFYECPWGSSSRGRVGPRRADDDRGYIERRYEGYVTDIITDLSLQWLDQRDPEKPFCLLCHHKAPHRRWEPHDRHQGLFPDDVLEPPTFWDDYANRSLAAQRAKMRIDRDLDPEDTKGDPPADLKGPQLKQWKYQRYIKDYLRCVQAVDDSVGTLLDYLDTHGLAENTLVIYTSDQGFFLGDHGWYDKRFMYEESLRMPFVVRYPREIKPGSVNADIAINNDFAPTFLDVAGLPTPPAMQGRSLRPLLQGHTPDDWRDAFYYRYFMHLDPSHHTTAHYGVRTRRYKLIYYYEPEPGPQEWELFDLERDPLEMCSVYADPTYAPVVAQLQQKLRDLRRDCGDETNPW